MGLCASRLLSSPEARTTIIITDQQQQQSIVPGADSNKQSTAGPNTNTNTNTNTNQSAESPATIKASFLTPDEAAAAEINKDQTNDNNTNNTALNGKNDQSNTAGASADNTNNNNVQPVSPAATLVSPIRPHTPQSRSRSTRSRSRRSHSVSLTGDAAAQVLALAKSVHSNDTTNNTANNNTNNTNVKSSSKPSSRPESPAASGSQSPHNLSRAKKPSSRVPGGQTGYQPIFLNSKDNTTPVDPSGSPDATASPQSHPHSLARTQRSKSFSNVKRIPTERKEQQDDSDSDDDNEQQNKQNANGTAGPQTPKSLSRAGSFVSRERGSFGRRPSLSRELSQSELAAVKIHPSLWTKPEFFQEHIEQVFDHYSGGSTSGLTFKRILRLASDSIEQFALDYEKMLREKYDKSGQNLSEEKFQEHLKVDLAHLLPGATRDEQTQKCAKFLFKQLTGSGNKSGGPRIDPSTVITKQQFFLYWGEAHRELFDLNKVSLETADPTLKCIIM